MTSSHLEIWSRSSEGERDDSSSFEMLLFRLRGHWCALDNLKRLSYCPHVPAAFKEPFFWSLHEVMLTSHRCCSAVKSSPTVPGSPLETKEAMRRRGVQAPISGWDDGNKANGIQSKRMFRSFLLMSLGNRSSGNKHQSNFAVQLHLWEAETTGQTRAKWKDNVLGNQT